MLCAIGWILASMMLFSLFVSLCVGIKLAQGKRVPEDDNLEVPGWVSQKSNYQEVEGF